MTLSPDIDTLQTQADSYFRKELYSKALLLYSQILCANPDDTDTLYKRGKAKNCLGNIAGAIQDMTHVLAIDPEHVLARVKRSEYAMQLIAEDDPIIFAQLPAYCRQFHTHEPDILKLPSDMQQFVRDIQSRYHDRAWKADEANQLEHAIQYWQDYYDVGGTIDWDHDLILGHIEWLKQRLASQSDDE